MIESKHLLSQMNFNFNLQQINERHEKIAISLKNYKKTLDNLTIEISEILAFSLEWKSFENFQSTTTNQELQKEEIFMIEPDNGSQPYKISLRKKLTNTAPPKILATDLTKIKNFIEKKQPFVPNNRFLEKIKLILNYLGCKHSYKMSLIIFLWLKNSIDRDINKICLRDLFETIITITQEHEQVLKFWSRNQNSKDFLQERNEKTLETSRFDKYYNIKTFIKKRKLSIDRLATSTLEQTLWTFSPSELDNDKNDLSNDKLESIKIAKRNAIKNGAFYLPKSLYDNITNQWKLNFDLCTDPNLRNLKSNWSKELDLQHGSAPIIDIINKSLKTKEEKENINFLANIPFNQIYIWKKKIKDTLHMASIHNIKISFFLILPSKTNDPKILNQQLKREFGDTEAWPWISEILVPNKNIDFGFKLGEELTWEGSKNVNPCFFTFLTSKAIKEHNRMSTFKITKPEFNPRIKISKL
jgi:hypothetical protein